MMILSSLNKNFLFTENDQYGIYREFSYLDHRGNQRQPNPTILYLGTKPGAKQKNGTINTLVCGIALDYLNPEEHTRLRQALPQIMQAKGKDRYRVGKELLPDIFAGINVKPGSKIPHQHDSKASGGGGAFRSYVQERIKGAISKKMLALKVEPEDQTRAEKLANEDGLEWTELTDQTKNQYLEQATRKRGEEEIEYETFKRDLEPEEEALEEPEEPEEPEPEPAPPKVKPTAQTQPAAPPLVKPTMTRIEPGAGIEPGLPPTKDITNKLQKAPQPTLPIKVDKAKRQVPPTNIVDKETKEQSGADPNEDVS